MIMTNPGDQIIEVRVRGRLDDSWADWFEGFVITRECDGTTTLAGEGIDQSALYGVLKKVRDLGMPLISVNQVGRP